MVFPISTASSQAAANAGSVPRALYIACRVSPTAVAAAATLCPCSNSARKASRLFWGDNRDNTLLHKMRYARLHVGLEEPATKPHARYFK